MDRGGEVADKRREGSHRFSIQWAKVVSLLSRSLEPALCTLLLNLHSRGFTLIPSFRQSGRPDHSFSSPSEALLSGSWDVSSYLQTPNVWICLPQGCGSCVLHQSPYCSYLSWSYWILWNLCTKIPTYHMEVSNPWRYPEIIHICIWIIFIGSSIESIGSSWDFHRIFHGTS